MNKKKNPDLVRNIPYLLRLNKPEDKLFQSLAERSNFVKPLLFLREMATKGFVVERAKKEENIVMENLLAVLIEYRTNFKRLGNLIKIHHPSLTLEITQLVKSIQHLIDEVV